MKAVTPAQDGVGRCLPTHAASLRRRSSSLSFSAIPAKRRTARPSKANGAPAASESPAPKSTTMDSGLARSQVMNSCSRRDFPMPAGPETKMAVAWRSKAESVSNPARNDNSCPRPKNVAGRPSRLRLPSSVSRGASRCTPVSSRTSSKRAPIRDATPSSTRTRPGRVVLKRSAA
jgi:hypothetical protein